MSTIGTLMQIKSDVGPAWQLSGHIQPADTFEPHGVKTSIFRPKDFVFSKMLISDFFCQRADLDARPEFFHDGIVTWGEAGCPLQWTGGLMLHHRIAFTVDLGRRLGRIH